MAAPRVPELRIRSLNRASVRADGDFVLYWMTGFRRPRWNFALQWAAELAEELDRPLLVLEPLRSGYRWASDRFHAFVLQGMADNRAVFERDGVAYHPYVEPHAGAGSGLLAALGESACAVITDDQPGFFLPRMQAAAAGKLDIALQAVDSNGLYPIRATDRVFTTAASFRRHLQKTLRPHLEAFPTEAPLAGRRLPELTELPEVLRSRWPAAPDALLAASPEALSQLDIDHSVPAVEDLKGGAEQSRVQLDDWLERGLPQYHEGRNQPEEAVASGLSPWLHFGHISAHEIFARLTERDAWTPAQLAERPNGSREGWWNTSPEVEAFLDELITWREIGLNRVALTDDYDRYESLPDFARTTLEEHAADERPHLYALDELERAATHDEIWNAAQNELVQTGRMHNYLRMLWGKKVLEWSATPQDALDALIELNNKYALDGRDANSYSGIFWCLGRYDRAWGPERPIFGKVRYMSSDSTRRKLRLERYLDRFAERTGA
ncbi:MAG: cryptochrome/DNA photolyase family protein [Planctomycetota bacterium]|jgi:deoxyribodipyrimidine photo-lyase